MEFDWSACLDGDSAAWARFVDRWSPVIVTAVRRGMLGFGPEEIEDTVQDVFLRLVRNDFRLLRTYDPDRAGLSTWLTLVARSTALDRVRRRRRPTVSLENTAAPAVPPPAPDPPHVDLPLELLTPRQRLILRLLFDDGRTVEEAAAILKVRAQTIRSGKHKALTRLREHFQAAGVPMGDDSSPAGVSPRRPSDEP